MTIEQLKNEIKRFVADAGIIAPSIENFEKNGTHGQVTDENLMWSDLPGWEMESKAVIIKLKNINQSLFSELYDEYLEYKEKSKKYHSKSILVHQIQQLLIGAYALLQSPLAKSDMANFPIPNEEINIDQNYAFIAMPMDPNNHSLIDVLDAIKEAADQCGVYAERVDEPQINERITDRIIESIKRAQYVIVDLTKSRPNVYFEAGFAHGLGRIPIYIACEGTELEFDLKDYPVLFFRNLKELKSLLKRRINSLKENTRT
jgi:hypothetical protein